MTGSNINPNGTRDTAFTQFCWKVLQKSFNWPHTSVLDMGDEKKPARILVLVIGLRVMNSHIVICTWMTLFLVILSFLGIGSWKWLQTVIMTLVVIMSTNADQFQKALGVSFKMRYHFLQTDIMGLTDGPSSKPPHDSLVWVGLSWVGLAERKNAVMWCMDRHSAPWCPIITSDTSF